MQTSVISATGPAAFGVIAERFRRAGQADKAVTLCREGLEKFPDHLSARVTLGWSLLDIGEHDEAFAQLKSVLKRAPDNLAAIRGLAELHERGIGLSFDSMPDADVEMELDPVMSPAEAPIAEAPIAEGPRFEDHLTAGDLDPIFEPETPMAPAIASPHFEIEDVIDEIGDVIGAGEPDAMFDLSSLLALEPVNNVIAMPEPAVLRRAMPAVVDRAPLALRDQPESAESDELSQWLARVRERRTESVSQYMAG